MRHYARYDHPQRKDYDSEDEFLEASAAHREEIDALDAEIGEPARHIAKALSGALWRLSVSVMAAAC